MTGVLSKLLAVKDQKRTGQGGPLVDGHIKVKETGGKVALEMNAGEDEVTTYLKPDAAIELSQKIEEKAEGVML